MIIPANRSWKTTGEDIVAGIQSQKIEFLTPWLELLYGKYLECDILLTSFQILNLLDIFPVEVIFL